MFDSIWIFSPSARIDSAYGPLEKHIEGLKNKGGLVAEWDLEKLNLIIDDQRRVTEEEKLRNHRQDEHMAVIKQKMKFNNLEVRERTQEMNERFRSIDKRIEETKQRK